MGRERIVTLTWGELIIVKNEKNEIRRYLLGQLDTESEERLELSLLSDASFIEEFDTTVDEITDQYVRNELQATERQQVEQYFLKSTERKNKARFAAELLQAADEQAGKVEDAVVRPAITTEPGIFERIRLFLSGPSVSLRLATALTAMVILVGVVYQISRPGPSGNFAVVNLTISTSDRATGSKPETVKLSPGTPGIRFVLNVPDQSPPAKSYRVELIDEQEVPRNLPVKEWNAQSVIVEVPANKITRGSYLIHLHVLKLDNKEERIRGSYSFVVE